MSNVELIIFDLDGTLIDSLDDLTTATNHMLAAMGRGVLTREQVRMLVGQGARRLVERALPDLSGKDLDYAISLFLSYNEAHIADRTRFYPGVRETLVALQQAGYRLAVISNKNVALCQKVLQTLDAESFFLAIMGADSMPFRKPSPEPVLKLLGDFGVPAKHTVLVGDSINDVAAGKAAGVQTVGCDYGYGELAELADADFLIGEFPALLHLPIFDGTSG